MRFWESTAFRVWLTFGAIGLIVAIPLSIYFNTQQRAILQNYTKKEFDVNASIAASVIEEAIKNESLDGLENYISNITSHSDFVYIAIIENDKVFSCFPKEYTNSVLVKSDELIYSESPLNTDLINGEIVITASRIKDELILQKINEPFIYLIIISILSSIVLFALSLRYLSRPIFRSISIAEELGKQNYSVEIKKTNGKNEIAVLNNSLFYLRNKLIQLKKENDNYKIDLEKQIKIITKEIQDKNSELSMLNKNLEEKVIEKTKANIDMSNSLIAQEKLVLIGEVSSGIAHDLNTPLGSIKASNDSLINLVQQINIKSEGLSDKAVELIKNVINLENPPNPFQKNRWIKVESKEIQDYLEKNNFNCEHELAIAIASLGINHKNKDLIEKIVSFKEPLKITDLIKDYLIALRLISGIEEAVSRSILVVSNLNRYIKKDVARQKKNVNLKNSLQVLETLFKFRLKNNVTFELDVNEDYQIFGIENELFQVWTNLFKNALDAFDSENIKSKEKIIKIYSEKINDKILLHFENNGPKIPENYQNKILKKYFTTKNNKGTGLGLSIVSKIVSEHYGKIHFFSSNEKTIFTLTFQEKKV